MNSLREVVTGMIEAFGHGRDAMAVALGMSPSQFHNRRFGLRGQRFDEDDYLAMQSLSKTTLYVEYLAARSGGVFVALPDCGDVDNDELLEKQQELVEELGVMTHKLRSAIRNDGAIDASEQRDLHAEVSELYRKAHELVAVAVKVYGKE